MQENGGGGGDGGGGAGEGRKDWESVSESNALLK